MNDFKNSFNFLAIKVKRYVILLKLNIGICGVKHSLETNA